MESTSLAADALKFISLLLIWQFGGFFVEKNLIFFGYFAFYFFIAKPTEMEYWMKKYSWIFRFGNGKLENMTFLSSFARHSIIEWVSFNGICCNWNLEDSTALRSFSSEKEVENFVMDFHKKRLNLNFFDRNAKLYGTSWRKICIYSIKINTFLQNLSKKNGNSLIKPQKKQKCLKTPQKLTLYC